MTNVIFLNNTIDFQYTGTVLRSFDYVITPTHGSWFKTNHQSCHYTVSTTCVTLMQNTWRVNRNFAQRLPLYGSSNKAKYQSMFYLDRSWLIIIIMKVAFVQRLLP